MHAMLSPGHARRRPSTSAGDIYIRLLMRAKSMHMAYCMPILSVGTSCCTSGAYGAMSHRLYGTESIFLIHSCNHLLQVMDSLAPCATMLEAAQLPAALLRSSLYDNFSDSGECKLWQSEIAVVSMQCHIRNCDIRHKPLQNCSESITSCSSWAPALLSILAA